MQDGGTYSLRTLCSLWSRNGYLERHTGKVSQKDREIKTKLHNYVTYAVQLRLSLAPVVLAYKNGDLSRVSKREWDRLIECFEFDPTKGKKIPTGVDFGEGHGGNLEGI